MKSNKLKELERQAHIRQGALESAGILCVSLLAAAVLITLALAFA